MDIKINFEELKNNHPDLIKVLVEKMRSTNSKGKDKPEQEFEFYYSFGVAVKGISFDEMIGQLKGKHTDIETEKGKSTFEIINEKLKSIIGLSLVISDGRTKRYVALSDKPKLFIEKFEEIHMKEIKDSQKEQERLSNLTQEEKDREIQEHINDLTDMGGFVGFNVGEKGITRITTEEIDYDVDDILDKIGRVGYDGLTSGEKKFLEENSK